MFAFVADHQNLPAWTVGVKSSQRITAGPAGRGSTYRIEGMLLGRTIRSSYEVTAFEPGRGFEGTMTSPMFGFSERYRFEAEHAATRVQMSAIAEPHGSFRLLAPVMAAGIRRQVKADHRRLKALLEGRNDLVAPAS
ncbi:MAG TPA: SRPBCC family protein [Streptosporangiaceae bacterium]|nr:SRPBCC family protein [Streptosporangiaceae bacterium]